MRKGKHWPGNYTLINLLLLQLRYVFFCEHRKRRRVFYDRTSPCVRLVQAIFYDLIILTNCWCVWCHLFVLFRVFLCRLWLSTWEAKEGRLHTQKHGMLIFSKYCFCTEPALAPANAQMTIYNELTFSGSINRNVDKHLVLSLKIIPNIKCWSRFAGIVTASTVRWN